MYIWNIIIIISKRFYYIIYTENKNIINFFQFNILIEFNFMFLVSCQHTEDRKYKILEFFQLFHNFHILCNIDNNFMSLFQTFFYILKTISNKILTSNNSLPSSQFVLYIHYQFLHCIFSSGN